MTPEAECLSFSGCAEHIAQKFRNLTLWVRPQQPGLENVNYEIHLLCLHRMLCLMQNREGGEDEYEGEGEDEKKVEERGKVRKW